MIVTSQERQISSRLRKSQAKSEISSEVKNYIFAPLSEKFHESKLRMWAQFN